MRNWIINHRHQLLPAIASGLLLTLAFPNFDQGWLAWIALVPLLLILRKGSWRAGFWIGFAAGLAHYLTLIYWTAHTMHSYGHLPWFQSIFILVLLAAYLSLYPALFGVVLTQFSTRPAPLVFVAPATWVALEFTRTWLFTGFPWELIGYSQYDHLWMIQIADIAGVYGVSALIVMVNAALTLAILYWLDKPWHSHMVAGRALIISAATAAGMVTLTLGYGIYRVGHTDMIAETANQAKVAVIQGNIDQAVKWDPKFQLLTTTTYRKITLKTADEDTDLVIWPETATPFYFLHDKNLSSMVIDTVHQAGTHFIIGSPFFKTSANSKPNAKAYQLHNSAFIMTPEGKSGGRYDKVHLVPFGEYVPLKRWLPFIKKMVAQVGDFKPGTSGSTLEWKNHLVGVQICYEVIFPSLARDMVKNGAHLLVNITNDAWFGRTSAAYQHYSMAVFRAVENKRWLARAANTGISGFIDPCGRIVEATPIYEESAAVTRVALLDQKSYYCLWGDWPLALLAFALPLLISGRFLLGRLAKKKQRRHANK